MKEVAAHVWKCSPWSAAAAGAATVQSAEQLTLLITHGKDFYPGRIKTIIIHHHHHHHGSSENTGENERRSVRKVQQDPVHG